MASQKSISSRSLGLSAMTSTGCGLPAASLGMRSISGKKSPNTACGTISPLAFCVAPTLPERRMNNWLSSRVREVPHCCVNWNRCGPILNSESFPDCSQSWTRFHQSGSKFPTESHGCKSLGCNVMSAITRRFESLLAGVSLMAIT